MGKREDLIAQYADDLKNKCGMTPDMDLLTKVTIGCGPAIYNADASTVAGSQPAELETVKNNFLIKKLGLSWGNSFASMPRCGVNSPHRFEYARCETCAWGRRGRWPKQRPLYYSSPATNHPFGRSAPIPLR